ncbi:MAG: hypothetical protein ACRD8W_10360 [Nitrososphaeraceae archaeon]
MSLFPGNISRNNTTALDLGSDGKNMVVIWLESNKTDTISAPMIRISDEDFWKIFGPLFELTTNTTREELYNLYFQNKSFFIISLFY